MLPTAEEARTFYGHELVGQDPEPRRLLLNLCYQLAGFAEIEIVPDPRSIAYEYMLIACLERLFRAEWPQRIPVDLAGWVNFGGAKTKVSPDHIPVSAADPSHRGDGALEILVHKASHTVVRLRPGGAIVDPIEEAS